MQFGCNEHPTHGLAASAFPCTPGLVPHCFNMSIIRSLAVVEAVRQQVQQLLCSLGAGAPGQHQKGVTGSQRRSHYNGELPQGPGPTSAHDEDHVTWAVATSGQKPFLSKITATS